jgi:hypothetical protein
MELQTTFEEFKTYQQDVCELLICLREFIILEKLFEGVSLIDITVKKSLITVFSSEFAGKLARRLS